MKVGKNFKLKVFLMVFACITVGIVFLAPKSAGARTGQVGSSVQVIVPLSVTSDKSLEWGALLPPSAASELWIINCDGFLLGPLGGDPISGDHSLGQFTINGQPGAAVQYNASVVANFPSGSGVFLSGITLCPPSPQFLNQAGSLVVRVGGSLTINPGAITPSSNAVIAMTANY